MARLPYTNFHELNQDWIIKQIKTAYTANNPPPYPVKSVNGQTGIIILNSDHIIDVDTGIDLTDALRAKQNRPAQTGIAGQVLGLDNQLNPVWVNLPAIPSPAVTIVRPVSGNTFVLDPCPVSYSFGEKAELTVVVTADSEYHFAFSCPSGTPTVLTITGAINTAGDVILEAGAYYDVNVWDGLAYFKKIVVTGG